jgi:hypothetical protein
MAENTTAAEKALASKGSKLHTHQMHIRRGTKGGYIAKHDLADDDGNPPQDGQSSTAEYPLGSHQAMMEHVAENMPPSADDEQPPAPQGGTA